MYALVCQIDFQGQTWLLLPLRWEAETEGVKNFCDVSEIERGSLSGVWNGFFKGPREDTDFDNF